MIKQLRSALTRKTSSTNFIPVIDGFRFFAIGTVVLYHLNTHFGRVIASEVEPSYVSDSLLQSILRQGGVGVNVFFVISGFILALPFARHYLNGSRAVRIKGYLIRRLTSLEPPYVISLTLFLGAHIFMLGESLREMMPHYLASLFYVHGFVYDEWSTINPVAWSLEVEVQFYLLAPLLAMVFKIRGPVLRRTVIITLILASILHRHFNYEWIEDWHLRKSILMHFHEFFIGFLLTEVFIVNWQNGSVSKSFLWDLIGIAAMAALFVWNDPFHLSETFIFTTSLFLAFASIFRGPLLNRIYSNPMIVIIGGMCYTIYLLHYALIAFLAERTQLLFNDEWSYAANLGVQALAILPVVLLVSAVFFALIERPCMDRDWPVKLKAKIISIFA